MSMLAQAVGPGDHVLGRHDAPASVVEYGDYACSACARAHNELAEVLRRSGNDVRYTFRHFPLTRIHPRSMLAAQAAQAAAVQGRFWAMHSMLLANQHALEPEHLMVYAETLGLDLHRFARDLRSGDHLPKIQNDLRSGIRSGVSGTPSFFVDGLQVARGWNAVVLGAAVDGVLQRSSTLSLRHGSIRRR
jgi:protein-disulfide isomerase